LHIHTISKIVKPKKEKKFASEEKRPISKEKILELNLALDSRHLQF